MPSAQLSSLVAEPEEVWVAGVEDKPGALARKLAGLAEAGADLGFIIARRAPEDPGAGVVFVTPLRGDREVEAAAEAGFSVSRHLHSLRIEGTNEPGIAARIAQRMGPAGLNLRGFSGAMLGTQFVLHLAFDSVEDQQQAIQLLRG